MTRESIEKFLMEQVMLPEDRLERKQLIGYLLDDMEDYASHDWKWVARQLNDSKPIQYISHLAHFYGYKFYVDEHVLIPRPETEELVYLLEKEMGFQSGGRALDIGTGSGVIPICLKLKQPAWDVEGWDVSSEALKVAEQNGRLHAVEIDWRQANILCDVLEEDRYDIIVSNPPYIPRSEARLMSANVLDYEPHIALFVSDDDPLLFYRRIAVLAQVGLKNNGLLVYECNEYNAEQVQELLQSMGYRKVEIIKDMQGKNRICRARWIDE